MEGQQEVGGIAPSYQITPTSLAKQRRDASAGGEAEPEAGTETRDAQVKGLV